MKKLLSALFMVMVVSLSSYAGDGCNPMQYITGTWEMVRYIDETETEMCNLGVFNDSGDWYVEINSGEIYNFVECSASAKTFSFNDGTTYYEGVLSEDDDNYYLAGEYWSNPSEKLTWYAAKEK